jgi:hypothetical protein
MTIKVLLMFAGLMAIFGTTSAMAQRSYGPGLNGSQMLLFDDEEHYQAFLHGTGLRGEPKLTVMNRPELETAHFELIREFNGNLTASASGTNYRQNDNNELIVSSTNTRVTCFVIRISDGPLAGRTGCLAGNDLDSIERHQMSYVRFTNLARENDMREKRDTLGKIYSATFSGLKLGMNLRTALDILNQQGYRDLRSGQETYIYKTFKYGMDCPKGQEVAICAVFGSHDWLNEMEFVKRDASGNRYWVIIDFTSVYMNSATSALDHARIKRMNAFINIKGPMTDEDYEKLANEKYGRDHNTVIGNIQEDWNHNRVCTCLYTDVGTKYENRVDLKVLKITINDKDMKDDINQAEVDRDVARRRKQAVKPVF